MRLLPCALLVLSIGGCSSSPTVSPKTDGGGDRPRDTNSTDTAVDPPTDSPVTPDLPPAELPPAACDPVAQSCGAGMKCALTCPSGTLTCVADPGGTLMHGDVCSPTDNCAKGHECLTPVGGGPTRCIKYCATDADCPAGQHCMQYRLNCAMGAAAAVSECTLAPLLPDGGAD